jgi:tetratricopeptide (TPR) repeat protein
MTWLDIASNDLPSAEVSRQWLEEARTLIDGDRSSDSGDADRDAGERVALAAAWNAAGRAFDQPAMLQTAREILSSLTKGAEARPDALFLLGSMDEAAGDAASAEQHYRQALQRKDDYAAAMNNLAYLLLTRGDAASDDDLPSPESNATSPSLDESRRLAERAVHLAPENADFHDTLGRIYLRLGRSEDALAEFQRALELEPNMIDSLIGQTTTLLALRRPRDAADMLARIDAKLKAKEISATIRPDGSADRYSLREPLQRELDAARRTLAATDSP